MNEWCNVLMINDWYNDSYNVWIIKLKIEWSIE